MKNVRAYRIPLRTIKNRFDYTGNGILNPETGRIVVSTINTIVLYTTVRARDIILIYTARTTLFRCMVDEGLTGSAGYFNEKKIIKFKIGCSASIDGSIVPEGRAESVDELGGLGR